MCRAVIQYFPQLLIGRKNTQIYIIKWAKKLGSGKCNSQDLELGENHTASQQKIKNFT
jgi:hypothetical protein